MARFTNYATLSYNGVTTDSNTVTGELVEILTISKTAVSGSYSTGGRVTYALSLVNSGTANLTGLTLTDDLGGYAFGGTTVYPLNYLDGTVRYYVNGVLQTAPAVTAGPPLTLSGITVPAGGNAVIVYEAAVTGYAQPGTGGSITNTVTATGSGISSVLTATATVGSATSAELRINKAISPATVSENGTLTYTFTLENTGGEAATATDNAVLTDTFSPRLSGLTVTFNGTAWVEGTDYTYDATTGVFTTAAGKLTVPAATFTQGANGIWTATPGSAVLTVTGTV